MPLLPGGQPLSHQLVQLAPDAVPRVAIAAGALQIKEGFFQNSGRAGADRSIPVDGPSPGRVCQLSGDIHLNALNTRYDRMYI
jgi:hypothetical protein